MLKSGCGSSWRSAAMVRRSEARNRSRRGFFRTSLEGARSVPRRLRAAIRGYASADRLDILARHLDGLEADRARPGERGEFARLGGKPGVGHRLEEVAGHRASPDRARPVGADLISEADLHPEVAGHRIDV